jgi:hypothetical protein
MRHILLAIVVLLALAVPGCAEVDLGEVPLYCNLGEPRCPGGYICERRGTDEVCVREDGEQSEGPASEGDGGPFAADGS